MIDLDTVLLEVGAHPTRGGDVCLLEAAAWYAGEPHSDAPACVSPVLTASGRRLNDILPDQARQRLVPLIPRLVRTAGDGQDEARAFLGLDWMVRCYAAVWLELAGLAGEAGQLRGLPRITDLASAQDAHPVVRSVQERAAAAWVAAVDEARVAAWNATWDAAWDAATAAAAAGTTTQAALRPTVNELQDSAVALYTAMIDPSEADAVWDLAGSLGLRLREGI